MDTLSSINDDMCLILYFTVEKNSNYIVKQMLPDYWSNHHFLCGMHFQGPLQYGKELLR